MEQLSAKVLRNERLNPDSQFYLLQLEAPAIASSAKPGQFVMLAAGNDQALFLKRPMGINETDPSGGTIRLVYQVIGKGTLALSKLCNGDELEILGPLGNGWQINDGIGKACIVGGGSGTATLLPLAAELKKQGLKQIDIILGGKAASYITCRDEFADKGNLLLATEDGSLGQKGMVDLYFDPKADYDIVYACGPEPMLRAVAGWTEAANIDCQVSLEERMGCGFGVCVGCVCKTKSDNNDIAYKRVCKEGPVFAAREVFFDD